MGSRPEEKEERFLLTDEQREGIEKFKLDFEERCNRVLQNYLLKKEEKKKKYDKSGKMANPKAKN